MPHLSIAQEAMPHNAPHITHAPHTSATATFTVAAADYAMRGLESLASRWWWALFLPIAAMLAAAAFDWRWGIVALAALFLIIPTLLMFVWLSLTTCRQAVSDIYPHCVTTSANGDITILYNPLQQTQPADATDCETSAANAVPAAVFVPAPVNIPVKKISGIATWRRFIALQAATADGDTTILIPVSAFACDADAAAFYHKLSDSTQASPA